VCTFLNHHIQNYILIVKYIKNLIEEAMQCVGFFSLFSNIGLLPVLQGHTSKIKKIRWEGKDIF